MEKDALESLVNQGLSIRKIAEVVGKGQTTVRYWLGVHDLKTRLICRCRTCEETDESKFYKGRYTICKTCRDKAQRDRYRGYKQQGVAYKRKKSGVEYKGGGCCKCGYDRCMAALDFHHRDPSEKDPDWKKMRNWKFERVKAELDKCDLVCRNCHAEIHYGIDPID
jgi:hypothetical protein